MGQEGLYHYHFDTVWNLDVSCSPQGLHTFDFLPCSQTQSFLPALLYSSSFRLSVFYLLSKGPCFTSFLSDVPFLVHEFMPKTQVNIKSMTILLAKGETRSNSRVVLDCAHSLPVDLLAALQWSHLPFLRQIFYALKAGMRPWPSYTSQYKHWSGKP